MNNSKLSYKIVMQIGRITETHEEHLTANAMKEKGSRGEDKNK
jgi:hypothetical protein